MEIKNIVLKKYLNFQKKMQEKANMRKHKEHWQVANGLTDNMLKMMTKDKWRDKNNNE